MRFLLAFTLLSWTVHASNTPGTRISRSPPGSVIDQIVLEIPANDVQPSLNEHDRIQVISSAIRVLPREKKRYKRADPQWRQPKVHKFVTAKVEKVDPPSVIRVYPLDRAQRYLNNDYYNYRRNPPRRRIIYYATLPEIIHPPLPWQSSQAERMYLPPRTNEINRLPLRGNELTRLPPIANEVTRVQSNLIDVVSTRHTPKYTIIDVEPPYNYANSDKDRYYNDIRTPPYRHYTSSNPLPLPARPSYISEENLKPVKLQIPTAVNATEVSNKNTRLLPEDFARFV